MIDPTTLTGHWFSALQSLHKQIKTRCGNGGMDNLWYAPVSGGVKHCGNSRVNDQSHLGTSQLVTNMCSLNAQQMLRLPQARYFRQSQVKLLFSLDWNSVWIPPGFKHTPWNFCPSGCTNENVQGLPSITPVVVFFASLLPPEQAFLRSFLIP